MECIKSNDTYECVVAYLAELQLQRAKPGSEQTTSHGEHLSTQIEKGQTTFSDHESDVDFDLDFYYRNDPAPLTDVTFGPESVAYHWRYRYDYIPWVKRIWSALDPKLPAVAKDAAAMILLGNVNQGCNASSVFLYINRTARSMIEGKERGPVPRLYLAILQAMALSDERAKDEIYKLVPSLKPEGYPSHEGEGLQSPHCTWHWGSSSSVVDVYPLISSTTFSQTPTSLDLTDDSLWPVRRDFFKQWRAPGVELICFDNICTDWERHMEESSRESNPKRYKPRVSIEEGADLVVLAEMTREIVREYMQLEKYKQSAAKYEALTAQLKLMVSNGSIDGGVVGELMKQIEHRTI
ncbi:uncharacterized protein F4812DRAFT_461869 [Daldinia caldariorum]|uniref:uncharacterized protein n=1 Tax=Daldinia caldariorum TaxID=326644 RepID=UPI0020082B68|nr:uncharacterized protein F4812DRAFT_461869 [Daldinia caldariorum]KAI1465555.1 hypothetical protein F4812DRAFT_461869 [Daldinia caldariorum]